MFSNSHFHSIFSDGTEHPRELVAAAKAVGYKAVVLTDHDTMRGCYSLQREARRAGLISLIGCEVTTVGFDLKDTIHVVAIDFDSENEAMRALMKRGADRQRQRSEQLFVRGLERGTLREGTTWDEVVASFPDNDFFCTTQVFDVLMKKGIYTPDERREYWNANFAYNLEDSLELDKTLPPFATVDEAIAVIRKAGGVPIVAHPHGLIPYAEDIVKMGIMGFETHHPELNDDEIRFFENICKEHKLYESGGTDHTEMLSEKEATGYVSEENFMKLYKRELG